jgi:hypothetical protein
MGTPNVQVRDLLQRVVDVGELTRARYGKQAVAEIGIVKVLYPTFIEKLTDALTELPQAAAAYVKVGDRFGPK